MRCLIIANGSPPTPEQVQREAGQADLVIAINGGTAHALASGLYPDLVLGDLDSMPHELLDDLRSAEVQVLTYDPHKDETDLELALHEAARRRATRVTVLGAVGGRLDQTLGNVFLLSLPEFRDIHIRLLTGREEAFVTRGQATIHGEAGDTVSLIPLTPTVEGVTTQDLEYPLDRATLRFGPSLGISNTMTAATAQVSLREGTLLVIHGRQPRPPAPPPVEEPEDDQEDFADHAPPPAEPGVHDS